MALSETRLGLMPGGAGTPEPAARAGERRAKELILTASRSTRSRATSGGSSTGYATTLLEEA